MDLHYPRLLEINQRLKVITRAASDLLAEMEHLYALRERLAVAQSSAGIFRRATEQEAIRNWKESTALDRRLQCVRRSHKVEATSH